MKFGLKNNLVEQACQIFASFPEIERVIIYGSRAMGNFKAGSDIDLAIQGKNLDLEALNHIRIKLDDLLSPYTFDLSLLNTIENRELLDHIKRVGKLFYQK